MSSVTPRQPTQRSSSFHDAAAREAYASHFQPIALPALVAGTRWAAETLKSREQRPQRPDIVSES